jgi:hypothetical protein
MIKIEIDISDVDQELKRLEEAPGFSTILGLESVLSTTYALTQTTVPVDTGSLRGSGKVSSDYRDEVWSGELTYGGASAGFVHDPVLYAQAVLHGHRIVAWGRSIHGGKQYQSPNDYLLPVDVASKSMEDVVRRFVWGDHD